MDDLTQLFKEHHEKVFAEHGATAKGVDWGDEQEMLFRYDKMLAVLDRDFEQPEHPTFLDVGCGWGGLLEHARKKGIDVDYAGIDVVESMILHARENFPGVEFIHEDIFNTDAQYDYVVCNAILTQRLTSSIPSMEAHARRLIRKMYELCRYGIAFNMMSTRVNFMVQNLYYQNPMEMLAFCLTELSPKVRLDHGYSSLQSGKGKFFDFTVYIYKD